MACIQYVVMIHLSEQVRLIELLCLNRIGIICVTFTDKSQKLWTTYIFTEKIERTSDTLIGYMPIFQMLPKTSLWIRYHWYTFEWDV